MCKVCDGGRKNLTRYGNFEKNRRIGTNFEECDTDEAYHWMGLGH